MMKNLNSEVLQIELMPQNLIMAIEQQLKRHEEKLMQFFEPQQNNELLTRKEVAKMLKINISSVHNYTKQGKLIAYGLGGRVYYKRSQVEASLVKLSEAC